MRLDLFALDLKSVEAAMGRLGWPRYRARQIFRWIHQARVREFERMTDLSRSERDRLQSIAEIGRSQHTRVQRSVDGTLKFLLELKDGRMVESVLIPDADRLTLCLSTQVGCTLDCAFCLTGQMGLHRNLTPHEIVDQVLTVQDHLDDGKRLTNLVFMGMGEPLANLDALVESIARLTNRTWGLGFSPRRITISTAGLANRLKEVAGLGVNLAVSLNASTDAQRTRLMPAVNRLSPLKELLASCRTYPLPPGKRLTFEYVLLAHVNDSERDARRLTTILNGIRCKVNLIPFNEFPGSPFRRPEDHAILRFQSVLKQAGFDTFIRKSLGRDILGACGQLGRLSSAPELLALTPAGAGC